MLLGQRKKLNYLISYSSNKISGSFNISRSKSNCSRFRSLSGPVSMAARNSASSQPSLNKSQTKNVKPSIFNVSYEITDKAAVVNKAGTKCPKLMPLVDI